MTYRDALWTAIIGESDKYYAGGRIKIAKRDRYLKLTRYWRKAQ